MTISTSDIRRAKFWLQRWRTIGGGFIIIDDDMNLTRKTDDNPKLEAAYARAEGELVKELKNDRRKKDNVFRLIREAAAGRLVPIQPDEQKEDGLYCCEEHGTIDEGPDAA